MIRKLKSGEYLVCSCRKDAATGKRRNLGTFPYQPIPIWEPSHTIIAGRDGMSAKSARSVKWEPEIEKKAQRWSNNLKKGRKIRPEVQQVISHRVEDNSPMAVTEFGVLWVTDTNADRAVSLSEAR